MAKVSRKKKQATASVENRYKGWCSENGGKGWLERINAECISPKQFFNRYVKRRMPVVLTSSNTECLKAFSIKALSGISGDCTVAVERADPDSFRPYGRTDSSCRVSMKFSDFLSRMKDEELYCSTQPVPENSQGPTKYTSAHVQRLVDRGMIPETLPLMGNLELHQINAWIGCSEDGSSSGFHHDFHDNFYLLMAGEKQFRLSSPNFTSTKPTFGCKTAGGRVLVHKNGLISYAGDSIREDGACMRDVLKWKLKTTPSGELQDELEERILDEMILPVYTGENPPSFCVESTAQGEYLMETLKAGDMLYLPAGFYHEVISFNSPDSESSHHMAINYWYYPPWSQGSFEAPYEDNYWKDRWERCLSKTSSRFQVNRDRMRRNKLPLQFQYSRKEILRFVRRIEASKKHSQ